MLKRWIGAAAITAALSGVAVGQILRPTLPIDTREGIAWSAGLQDGQLPLIATWTTDGELLVSSVEPPTTLLREKLAGVRGLSLGQGVWWRGDGRRGEGWFVLHDGFAAYRVDVVKVEDSMVDGRPPWQATLTRLGDPLKPGERPDDPEQLARIIKLGVIPPAADHAVATGGDLLAVYDDGRVVLSNHRDGRPTQEWEFGTLGLAQLHTRPGWAAFCWQHAGAAKLLLIDAHTTVKVHGPLKLGRDLPLWSSVSAVGVVGVWIDRAELWTGEGRVARWPLRTPPRAGLSTVSDSEPPRLLLVDDQDILLSYRLAADHSELECKVRPPGAHDSRWRRLQARGPWVVLENENTVMITKLAPLPSKGAKRFIEPLVAVSRPDAAGAVYVLSKFAGADERLNLWHCQLMPDTDQIRTQKLGVIRLQGRLHGLTWLEGSLALAEAERLAVYDLPEPSGPEEGSTP